MDVLAVALEAAAGAAEAAGALPVGVPASGALLRSEVLRGTPWAVGAVAYAGPRCKALLESALEGAARSTSAFEEVEGPSYRRF
jgi:hypothetical protein